MAPTALTVYTDGSSVRGIDNISYGGAGVWFGYNDDRNSSIPILHSNGTNQLAELTAMLYALKYTKDVDNLTIYTDSKYTMGCIMQWYKKWSRDGWKTSKGQPVFHANTIRACRLLLNHRESRNFSTSILHVKAHANIEGNEGADKLSKAASALAMKIIETPITYFCSGPLSQLYVSPFVGSCLDRPDQKFSCVEQYYAYGKSVFFDDLDAQRSTLELTSPYDQTEQSRGVIGFDQVRWMTVAESVVIDGNVLKFSQNSALRTILLSTGDSCLVGASSHDTVWGIGLSQSQAMSGIPWRGQNLLGIALMKVRTLLRSGS